MMIILASASPRRQELLGLITKDFRIVCSDVDERSIESSFKGSDIRELPCELAAAKARDVYAKEGDPSALVIGADTAVICDGKVLGKPADETEARDMLTSLSGKLHSVVTGVCVKTADTEKIFYEESFVRFNPLDEYQKGLIERYISSGDPYDKAGAYGIQTEGALLIESIEGDWSNIVGLPVSRLNKVLYELT